MLKFTFLHDQHIYKHNAAMFCFPGIQKGGYIFWRHLKFFLYFLPPPPKKNQKEYLLSSLLVRETSFTEMV